MDESPVPPLPDVSAHHKEWPDWRWLLVLVALALPLRGWLAYNTEVLARDSVGYIRCALYFDHDSWGDALRKFNQHPGFAFSIWAVSLPVRAVAGETSAGVMQACVQIVSGGSALLLLFPMFYLGKALWGARIGFGGALIFQFLPMSGQHLSDGISESLFLLLVTTALLTAVWSLQTYQRGWFLACGAATGLAYLTRPEGGVLLGAVGVVLLVGQFRFAWRQPWLRVASQLSCLAAGVFPFVALYVAATGALSVKPSVNQLLRAAHETPGANEPILWPPGLRAQMWAESFTLTTGWSARAARGAWAILRETSTALSYIGVVPIIVGLWYHGRRLLERPGHAVMLAYFVLHASCLMLLALTAGYVSDRHLMPLVMCLSFIVAAGVLDLACWWATWRSRAGARVSSRTMALASSLLLCGYLAIGMPQTLKRLHGNRAANRDAGRWLAQQLRRGDLVLDDHSWSHFYSGNFFQENKDVPLPADAQPKCYVVITRSSDPKMTRIRDVWERRLKFKENGTIVQHWPAAGPVESARLVIYAVSRNKRTHPWEVASR